MLMLRSGQNLLRERVNTFLGTGLLCSVAIWASVTIWQVATGENPVVTAFASVLERNLENY